MFFFLEMRYQCLRCSVLFVLLRLKIMEWRVIYRKNKTFKERILTFIFKFSKHSRRDRKKI